MHDDVLLKKFVREQMIHAEHERAFNTEVVKVLVDTVRTNKIRTSISRKGK